MRNKKSDDPSTPTNPMKSCELIDCRYPEDTLARCGYCGDARYVALWYDTKLSKLVWCDGIVTRIGPITYSWMYLIKDLAGTASVSHCQNLLSDKAGAIEALVFDRKEKHIYREEATKVQKKLYEIATEMGLISPLVAGLEPETLNMLLRSSPNSTDFESASEKAMSLPVTGAIHRKRLS